MHDTCITFDSGFGVLEKGLFAELHAFFEKNKSSCAGNLQGTLAALFSKYSFSQSKRD
jgi:hypothetical protein